MQENINRIYFDNAATTPVDPRVAKEVNKSMLEDFGNPSSIHSFGRRAKKALEEARDTCVKYIGADNPQELTFTSGGAESDQIVIDKAIKSAGVSKPHIITTQIEHKVIINELKDLKKNSEIEATFLPVDKYGKINIEDLKKEIRDNTALVTIMYANNEIGTIQPIREIGEYLEKLNEQRLKDGKSKIYFHTDAVQAFAYLDCNVKNLHVDYLSMSAHKIYGPKGIGFLYAKTNGGQERGKKAGTENTSGMIGLARAIEILKKEREKDDVRIEKLRDRLIAGVLKIPGTILTGHPQDRPPNLASFIFKSIEGESILTSLDLEGIAVSTGSACTSEALVPSHVLTACGYTPAEAQGNIRVSLGRFNTEEEVDRFLEVLPAIVKRLRAMSPL